MKNKKLLFIFFFCFMQKEYSNISIYDQDSIFFNILYISIKRSEATIDYLTHFIEFDNLSSNIHKQVLSKIRNPSKLEAIDFCNEYESQQTKYMDLIKYTLRIYNLYKSICNNCTGMLNDGYRELLKKQKELIASNLVKELFNLENIAKLIKDFFKNIEELDQQKRFGFLDIKNILEGISDKISLYCYYQKAYVSFDNVLINQYEYFMKLKYLFHSYYNQFWITIEKQRLAEIIKTYNFHMNLYSDKNNTTIKEMDLNNEQSEIIFTKNDLPQFVYNKFL
jgi:hypothetical protein